MMNQVTEDLILSIESIKFYVMVDTKSYGGWSTREKAEKHKLDLKVMWGLNARVVEV